MTSVQNRLKSFFQVLRKRWKLLLVLAVVIGTVGFFLYRRQQAALPTFTFIKPTYQNLTRTLDVSGVIDAKQKATLRFAAGGKIVSIGAKEGDSLKSGQTIATIDARDLLKRQQQDLNAYLRKRYAFDELTEANQDRTLPEAEVRRQRTEQLNLNDTVLQVEIRDIAIREARLAAPFNGILVSAPVITAGVNIGLTEGFEVINPNTLIFKAAVDEADIAAVRAGLKASIELDSYPDEPLSASVSAISYKSQQASTGTVFVVELPILGQDLLSRYRLGMNGNVIIEVEKRSNVLSIPLDSTRQRDDKTYVDVRTGDNSVEEREIKTGLETDEYVEVISGLTQDDEIMVPD